MKITKNTPDQLILETRPKGGIALQSLGFIALMLASSQNLFRPYYVTTLWHSWAFFGFTVFLVISGITLMFLGSRFREELTLDRYVPTAALRLGRGGRRNTVFSIPLTGEQHARVETYQSKDKPRLTGRAHRIAFVHDRQAGSDTFALPVLYRKGNPPREIVDTLNAWLDSAPPEI